MSHTHNKEVVVNKFFEKTNLNHITTVLEVNRKLSHEEDYEDNFMPKLQELLDHLVLEFNIANNWKLLGDDDDK